LLKLLWDGYSNALPRFEPVSLPLVSGNVGITYCSFTYWALHRWSRHIY